MRSPLASENAIEKPLPNVRGAIATSAPETRDLTRNVPCAASTHSSPATVLTVPPSRENSARGQSAFSIP